MRSVWNLCCLSGAMDETKRSIKMRKRTINILLLGIADSGKSTFLKQMRLISGDQFDPDEVKEYVIVIFQNMIKGMKVLLNARTKLRYPWALSESAAYAKVVSSFSYAEVTEVLNSSTKAKEMSRIIDYINVLELVRHLLKDDAIDTIIKKFAMKKLQFPSSVIEFYEQIDRIATHCYLPTTTDILLARRATRGQKEYEVLYKSNYMKFIDVGGQRSERINWLPLLNQEHKCILFMVPASDFDQNIPENSSGTPKNKLLEAYHTFRVLFHSESNQNSAFVVFLNKDDLLEKKVKDGVSIKKHFPEFEGREDNIDDVRRFILEMFSRETLNSSKILYIYHTVAIDTENVKFIFKSIRDTILLSNIAGMGMC